MLTDALTHGLVFFVISFWVYCFFLLVYFLGLLLFFCFFLYCLRGCFEVCKRYNCLDSDSCRIVLQVFYLIFRGTRICVFYLWDCIRYGNVHAFFDLLGFLKQIVVILLRHLLLSCLRRLILQEART